MRPPAPNAALVELVAAITGTILAHAGQDAAGRIADSLIRRFGPLFDRDRVDPIDLARAAADAAEDLKFGPPPPRRAPNS